MYTVFSNSFSGGLPALPFNVIVKGDEAEATAVFARRFGSPSHVTCDCCGSDFFVWEADTLEEAVEFSIGNQPVQVFL